MLHYLKDFNELECVLSGTGFLFACIISENLKAHKIIFEGWLEFLVFVLIKYLIFY